MKKRALALLTALTMVFSAIPVFAGDFEWEAVVSSSQVEVGEVFNLDFDVTVNPGVQNATIDISYDPSVVIPVATVDPAEDIMGYQSSRGYLVPLFDYNYVDKIINTTSVENGNLRIANYTTEVDSTNTLIEITDTGTLARITFKAVGSGNANLSLGRIAEVSRTPKKREGNLAYTISIPSVTVTGGENVTDNNNETTTTAATTVETSETTTEKVTSADSDTETTTKRLSSSSSGGYVTITKATTTTTTTTTVSDDDDDNTKATTTTQAANVTENATQATTADVSAVDTGSALRFNDIADYPWAVDYITRLADARVVSGYSDGSFKPNQPVKRADFIIMLLKAMGVDTAAKPQDNFTDVRADKYYYNAVGLAKQIGIASGSTDGTFNPEGYITRQDMMILAKKAVEIKTEAELTGDTAVLDKFADKGSISPYATESLAAMVEAGIVSGTGNNIQPKDNTTRAQAAVIICKIVDMMK